MPDGYTMNLKSLAKNSPPDYMFTDNNGYTYFFNVCRNTIMTCNGRDDAIAIQYNKEGKCVSILSKIAMSTDYIDTD